MTKHFFLIILLTVCAIGAQAADTKLKVVVTGNREFTPTVDYGFGKQTIKYDPSTGLGEFSIDIQAPMTMVMEPVKNVFRTIYLSPGANTTIIVDNCNKPATISFSGDCSKENDFINNSKIYSNKIFDSKKKSDILEIARLVDSMLSVNLSELNQFEGISEEFRNFEVKSLEARSAQRFLRECFVLEKNQTIFSEQLTKRISQDPQMLNICEYRTLLKNAVKKISAIEYPRVKDSERTKVAIETILKRFENPELLSYLIDIQVTPYIAFMGTSGSDYYIDLFNQYVTNPERIKNFKTIRALSEVVDKGKPCPDFTFNDVHDQPVSLKDLRGKFVFIDLWATWCGPCKAEIPYIQQLEERFHGKDLTFVSISVDKNKDREVWKKMVKEMKMGGVQLILGENWNWIKNFMPASLSVPRFILLDKEGVIVNPNMSRPSDPNTAKILEKVLTK